MVLIAGAIAGMLVAANPEHAGGFGSVPHFVFASLGFAGLTLWPAAAAKRGPAVPVGPAAGPGGCGRGGAVRPARLVRHRLIMAGRQVGLAERVMGGAQAIWPLAVVLSCYLLVRVPVPAREVNQASNA